MESVKTIFAIIQLLHPSCFFVVATCTVSQCDGPILLSNRSGTLSSAMASMHGCGTQTCPWVIQGHPGETIEALGTFDSVKH